MPEPYADLHLHTCASDGALPPAQMVEHAAALGIRILAITDHDVVSGVPEATRAGETLGVRVIPGVELSTGGGQEIHLLGYGIDPSDPALLAFLSGLLASRMARTLAMVEKLRALGFPVTAEDAQGTGEFTGRTNLARAMVKLGAAKSVREAFVKWLEPGGAAYVPRERLSVPEGIEALRAFGAVPVLAHPGRTRIPDGELSARLPGWIGAGLGGVEAYHASHHAADAQKYDRLARSHGLLVTGGSDSHGRAPEGAEIGDGSAAWRSVREDIERLLEQMTKA